jgi:hypothetical protein
MAPGHTFTGYVPNLSSSPARPTHGDMTSTRHVVGLPPGSTTAGHVIAPVIPSSTPPGGPGTSRSARNGPLPLAATPRRTRSRSVPSSPSTTRSPGNTSVVTRDDHQRLTRHHAAGRSRRRPPAACPTWAFPPRNYCTALRRHHEYRRSPPTYRSIRDGQRRHPNSLPPGRSTRPTPTRLGPHAMPGFPA